MCGKEWSNSEGCENHFSFEWGDIQVWPAQKDVS